MHSSLGEIFILKELYSLHFSPVCGHDDHDPHVLAAGAGSVFTPPLIRELKEGRMIRGRKKTDRYQRMKYDLFNIKFGAFDVLLMPFPISKIIYWAWKMRQEKE